MSRMRTGMRAIRRGILVLFFASLLSLQTIVIPVFAQPASDVDSIREGFPAYEEGCGDGSTGGLGQAPEGIDKFLQVLAYQEGNQPKDSHRPSPGATGKYQYQDPTWEGVTRTGYEPAHQYQRAYQAPENMQDAAAFIEYTKKFKTFNNDIKKIGISHYLPAANTNAALMNVVPPGNTLTPSQYGDKIVSMYKSDGPWSKIKIDYKSAPQIEDIAKKYGADLTAGGGGALTTLKYKAVGNIPEKGMDVGASIYGGNKDSGEWKPTNEAQNPGGAGNDDNGDSRNGPLPGKTAFAELSVNYTVAEHHLDFAALGNLKDHTKLAITYKGKTIVAEKMDVGRGGEPVGGKPRAIDLWWEAARLLDLTGSDVVNVRGVEDTTPVTPVGGDAQEAATNDNQICETVCGLSSGAILLDPGHSGPGGDTDKDTRDENGLLINDSSNPGERKQVFKVATEVKKQLEKDGYMVEMTKDKEDQSVNLKQRAEQANKLKVALAVSIHNTGGEFDDPNNTWSTPQAVGGHRTGNTGKDVKFELPDVATESKRIAEKIAETRKKAEGREVKVRPITFGDDRPDRSPGDLPIVQLYSKVPWVYEEVGQKNWNDENADKYAKGIADGIKAAIDKKKGGMADEGCGGGSGSLQAKAEGLAWHDGRKSHTPRSTYPKAVTASNNGVPLGAIEDCGVFVATVVRDSKIDPDYPGIGTGVQKPYLEDKAKNKGKWSWHPDYNSTKQLAPGDVMIVHKGSGGLGHTYMYIGPHGKWNAASASLNSYMPTYNVTYFDDTLGRGHYGVGHFEGGNGDPGEKI